MVEELNLTIADTNLNNIIEFVDDDMVEKLWLDMNGQATRNQIRRVAMETAAKFGPVTVTQYIPIFLYRETREKLGKLFSEKQV